MKSGTAQQTATILDTHDIVMTVMNTDDGIVGEAMVQKIVYLIKSVHPHLAIPEYEPQYFGPSSGDVLAAVSALFSFGYVSQENDPGSGSPGRYRYRPTRLGREYATDAARQHPGACRMIRGLTDTCLRMCGGSYLAVCFAAKMHYMRERSGRMTERSMLERGNDLAWGITENEMRNALNLLAELGLDPRK